MRDDHLDGPDVTVPADWQDTEELPLLPDPPSAGPHTAPRPAATGAPLAPTAVIGPLPQPPAPFASAPMWRDPVPVPWSGPWPTAVVVTDRRVPHDAVLVVAWVLAVTSLGYLLPWAVAATRGRSNHGGIAVVNLLLGWTGVGWAVALVMACSAHRPMLVQVVAPWPGQTAVGPPLAARTG